MRPICSEGRGRHADSNGSIGVSLALFVREIGADPSARLRKRLTKSWGAVAGEKQAAIVQSDERQTVSGFSAEKYFAFGASESFCEVQL